MLDFKIYGKEQQNYCKNNYPYCEGTILNWYHDRITNYLENKTDKI